MRNLELGDGYTLSLGDDIYSITGNGILNSTYTQAAQAIDENAMYAHQDENASLDSKWTKQENYDAEHGNVYKFTHGNNEYVGTDWSSSEFEDGTYVVSMDFKMSSYPTDDAKTLIHIDSETWQDRTTLYLRPNGKVSYVIRDAEAIRQTYATNGGTNYLGGEWSNYSVVYEKVGTTVGVTQYINGVKIHNTVTVYDKFRFKRITVVTDSTADLYIDNITCRKIESTDTLSIEKVSPVVSDSAGNISKLKIKFNQPIVSTATVSSVTVKKTGSATNLVSSYSVLGQYVYATVSGLTINDEYDLSIGTAPGSVAGSAYDGNGYSNRNYIVGEVKLYDDDTIVDSFGASCANKTLTAKVYIYNFESEALIPLFSTALFDSNVENNLNTAAITNTTEISKLECKQLSNDIFIPSDITGSYELASFVWRSLDNICALKNKTIH